MDGPRTTQVAVIGMACRLPGAIDSPEKLWEALLRGDDFVTVATNRDGFNYDLEDFYDPEPGVPGRTVSKWVALLDDFAGFEPEFFGINEREAVEIDPQHRLLLESAWEAVEHAGIDPLTLAGTDTSVFVGLTHFDYAHLAADAGYLASPYSFTGTNFSLGSGRISYAMNLRGPAVTVDTACSSGLSAVHLACRSLADGESDLALSGGATVSLELRKAAGGSAAGMLSPTGHCHAFDTGADGFVVGEGSVMLLLKRLPDALRDGDRILAVLRATATNQDGHSVNIQTPAEDAQVAVYRKALVASGVDADTVGMVEAHGTGTPVGDPIEYRSLAQVYGINGPCALTSAKTNFGHTSAAAGALGLMKAVLAVQHGVVPQNLHFNSLPEDLASIETELFVPQATTAWPIDSGQPRRAAVSSYGLSGTNMHAIVEQAPETAAEDDVAGSTSSERLLFLLSSTSATELRRTAGRLADWVAERGDDVRLPDLAYTLARRRGHRPVRTGVIARNREELIAALREVADSEMPYQPAVGRDDRGPVWVFSGQGSQWAGMGAALLAGEPVFAATVAEAEPLIYRESGFSVTEAMSAPEMVTGIDKIQPTLFTMQVALAATMKSYGVTPGAVIGHSMGEVAAAVVAGALSLDDGVRVICRRSRLMARIAGAGAMASVELPALNVLSELTTRGIDDVVVSVVASPQSTVVGGDAQTVRDLVASWEQREVMAREVAVDVASHSPQVDPILDELMDELADLTPVLPAVRCYSTVLYDPHDSPAWDARYWADNLRHTVRFAAAVQAALEDGHRVFAELAPHPLLTVSVQQTSAPQDVRVATLAAMRREQGLPFGLLQFVADLHGAGAAVDFAALSPGGRLVDAPLPTWTHRQLMLDLGGVGITSQGANTVAVHPLLGSHVRLPEEPERHVWHGDVGTALVPWLNDHRVNNVAVLPGAAYCEMALAAAQEVLGEACEVRDVSFEQMLMLDEQTPVYGVASVVSPGVLDFAVETYLFGAHLRRAGAVLRAVEEQDEPAVRDITGLLANHTQSVDVAALRSAFAMVGVQSGRAFEGLVAAHTAEGTDSVLAEVRLPAGLRAQQGGYGVHPALLDACFQSVVSHPDVQAAAVGGLLLPLGVRRLRAYGSARSAQYCYVRVVNADTSVGIEADLEVLDEQGKLLLSVQGLRMGGAVSQRGRADRVLNERLLTIEWHQRELAEVDRIDAGAWMLINTADNRDVLTTGLTDALKSADAECTTLMWPQHADHQANTELLTSYLGEQRFTGVVVVMGPHNGETDEQSGLRGEAYVRRIVRIARQLSEVSGEPPRLYVVTRKTHTVLPGDVANLEHAGLRGLLRVISTEHSHLRPTQIDVDDNTDVEHLVGQLLSGSAEDETAWRNGQWYTARLCPSPIRAEERHTTVIDHEQGAMRLQIRTPGDLESLELVAFDRVPPGPGEIEVAVTRSSINFADVLNAFGQFPAFEGHLPGLGMDFAGVVTAVGEGVTEHRVGDRVGGVSGNGCWGTFVTCSASLAFTLPDGLTDDEAAAITTVAATAWYGLHDMARMSAGDKVLIHSGTGGVGQAAIVMARAAGAEIYATAGSPQRRQLLRDWGVEHVYDSRTTEFADQIRHDTDGYGVDIVLNSVTGALQRASLELLTFGGRFVEIGKRDIYGDTRVGLFPFRRNLSFYAVDLALMSVTHPQKVRELLKTVFHLTADGKLPTPQITHYPLAEAATAIRVMAGARHTGKLLLDVARTGHSSAVVPPEQVPTFRSDGAYIITGGLGGLGLFLAEKMAAAGCGRIVLTSRSQPNQKAQETVQLIRATGADVVVECGDIAESETATRLVEVATATGLPLRGVLHAAAVVEDATLANITDELIEHDWAPKVYGAWNLHEATASLPLDWFCLFSSGAALIGSPGQGAYAAANSWLDAFCHWRRAHSLPATAIGWGAWAEIGRGQAIAEAVAEAGGAIAPDDGAYAFEALLRYDRPYTGYTPITGTPWLIAFAQRSPFAELFKSTGQSSTGSSKLRAELNALPREEWPSHLRRMLSEQLGLLLRRSIDPDRSLAGYGLDSLGNLELRTRIESETGIRINPSEISTVRRLAEHLCEKLAPEESASEEAVATAES